MKEEPLWHRWELEELGGYKGYGYATVVEILSAASGGQLFKDACWC